MIIATSKTKKKVASFSDNSPLLKKTHALFLHVHFLRALGLCGHLGRLLLCVFERKKMSADDKPTHKKPSPMPILQGISRKKPTQILFVIPWNLEVTPWDVVLCGLKNLLKVSDTKISSFSRIFSPPRLPEENNGFVRSLRGREENNGFRDWRIQSIYMACERLCITEESLFE